MSSEPYLNLRRNVFREIFLATKIRSRNDLMHVRRDSEDIHFSELQGIDRDHRTDETHGIRSNIERNIIYVGVRKYNLSTSMILEYRRV